MSYLVDLEEFLNNIGREKILELDIRYYKKNKIYENSIVVYANHYHNLINTDKYIINSKKIFTINREKDSIQISSLYGLINLHRLRINDIKQLYELPYIGDSNELGVLILDNNNLIKLPYLTNTIYYLCCDNNKLREIPSLPNNLVNLYCENNQIYVLPFINKKLYNKLYLVIYNNPITNYIFNGYKLETKKINKLYNFRYNYYLRKYGKRIFYYLLKKRMMKIKQELLETSAKIMMNPKRIERLLEMDEDLEDI
jgi:hypothetical protein